MNIRLIQTIDKLHYLRMRKALWPDYPHEEELEQFFKDLSSKKPSWTVFVAQKADGNLCGFIEVGQRNYAEGCETSPVAYIEGWYVDPDMQRRGVGRDLVEATEKWAKENGFTEIASDTWLDNDVSINAHKALGYTETERLVCFAKKLESYSK